MSLLAPLYAAGLLAVGLPILFHLIRRTPRGQQAFSSLMFLAPSPPRLTRRSRVEHWLLLLLRAAVLVLLAVAFSRPFLRSALQLNVSGSKGRHVVLLLDTSASMRRGNLWIEANKRAESVLGELNPADQVALATFDNGVRWHVEFQQAAEDAAEQSRALAKSQLEKLAPSWGGSGLDEALVAASDALAALREERPGDGDELYQIVLISDLQEGSRLERLQSYRWPESVQLEVQPVAAESNSNAGLQLLGGGAGGQREKLRARVVNQAGGETEQFALHLVSGQVAGESVAATSVYVPPGESRVVSVELAEDGRAVEQLVLRGDEYGFDNTVYLVAPNERRRRVLYLGGDRPDDPEGMHYYLQRAFDSAAREAIEVVASEEDEEKPFAEVDLAIAGRPLESAEIDAALDYLNSGGGLLYVVADRDSTETLQALCGREDLRVADRAVDDYAMLGSVDLDHPLFAPLADPRFSDFTKIHFWMHRLVAFQSAPEPRVVARFDDGDPAIIEQPVGDGRLWILTSSWAPADSQLALSSKFIPLLQGMLRLAAGEADAVSTAAVGEPIPLSFAGEPAREVYRPDGSVLALAADESHFRGASEPGIYRFLAGEREWPVAVHLPADESRTTPLDPERLAALGVRLGGAEAHAAKLERRRQMRDRELESRQKLWQWLLAAALVLLAAESWLAGRLARRVAS